MQRQQKQNSLGDSSFCIKKSSVCCVLYHRLFRLCYKGFHINHRQKVRKQNALSKRFEQIEYYLMLLLEAASTDGYSFCTVGKDTFPARSQSTSFLYRLLIQNGIEKQQAEPFLVFCESLNKKYELQKAEGLFIIRFLWNFEKYSQRVCHLKILYKQ